ncbi:MAG: hypothetical protein KKF62_19675 [Bacteroidetes bacterium]|nr:hypothetical protein [Bacteroidota bacterium]
MKTDAIIDESNGDTILDDLGDVEEPADEELAEDDGTTGNDKDTEEDPALSAEKPSKEPSIEERLAELEKANAGLKSDLIKERGRRQTSDGRLHQLGEMITMAKEGKASSEEPMPEPEFPNGGIPVQFNEDGNPYIDPKDLGRIQKPLVDKVDALGQKASLTDTQINYQRKLGNIIASDEAFEPASKKLSAAYSDLSKTFDKYIADNSLSPPTSLDEAIEMIDSSSVGKEFSGKYPNIRVDDVIEAFTSPRKFKTALNAFVSIGDTGELKKGGKGISPTLRALAKKAKSPVGVQNQSGKTGLGLDDIASINVEDFIGMSDADVAKIERALLQEEMG